MPPLEQLGVVTTRSGVLILIDTGYLKLWSHDRIPEMPDGVLSDEQATARANAFVDLRIVGADAERAGRLLDMSWNPLYVYDQPPTNVELQSKLNKLVREHKLDARLEVLSRRIPHRLRVDLAIQRTSDAARSRRAMRLGGNAKSETQRLRECADHHQRECIR